MTEDDAKEWLRMIETIAEYQRDLEVDLAQVSLYVNRIAP